MDEKNLIKFEKEIAKIFEDGKIKYPIHLSGTNEKQLIKIFKKVKKNDWIFSTWRNHYHWLLSGRSPKELKRQIIEHGSMHVYDKKFFTSAIVGGISSIALGVALALKKKKSKAHVWCFIGDMASYNGVTLESMRYACGHDLPITFIIEDNWLSVQTDTKVSWGENCKYCKNPCGKFNKKTQIYTYHRKYPHAGMGKFVLF